MADTIQVLALPNSGWNYDNERDDFYDRIRACNPRGYYVINGFSTVGDLVSQIQDIIDNEGTFPTLALLEIWVHANTGKIDGLTIHNVGAWGQALQGITSWTDRASIYLSGCNTGLTGRSVAQALAAAMPFTVGQFEHQIIVHGAAGYLYGSHACRNPRTECVYVRRSERRSRFWRWVWGFITNLGNPVQATLEAMTGDVEFKPKEGCRDAAGADAYNEFRNWT